MASLDHSFASRILSGSRAQACMPVRQFRADALGRDRRPQLLRPNLMARRQQSTAKMMRRGGCGARIGVRRGSNRGGAEVSAGTRFILIRPIECYRSMAIGSREVRNARIRPSRRVAAYHHIHPSFFFQRHGVDWIPRPRRTDHDRGAIALIRCRRLPFSLLSRAGKSLLSGRGQAPTAR